MSTYDLFPVLRQLQSSFDSLTTFCHVSHIVVAQSGEVTSSPLLPINSRPQATRCDVERISESQFRTDYSQSRCESDACLSLSVTDSFIHTSNRLFRRHMPAAMSFRPARHHKDSPEPHLIKQPEENPPPSATSIRYASRPPFVFATYLRIRCFTSLTAYDPPVS